MARNLYEEITNKIVAALEAGAGSYEQPWSNLGSGKLPRNIASGKAYRGVNVLALWASGAPGQWWGTYQQWQAIGGQVRKGEKSSTVVWFSPVTKNRTTDTGEQTEDKFLVMKSFAVFHSGQVDPIANEDGTPGTIKLPGAGDVPASQEERIEAAEQFFSAIGGTLRHGGDRAFYNPNADYIGMPAFHQFSEATAYYSTLAHEYIHWTGHKDRQDRQFGKRFGDEAYAMEELVAELGAAFTMGLSDLCSEPRADHARYLASWLKVLKSDSRAIFTVASKAQAAAEYLGQQAAAEYLGQQAAVSVPGALAA